MDALVDDQALDLMEHRRVRRVAVRPIDAARRDHAQRRAARIGFDHVQHRADLHRRGVGAQQHLALFCTAIREIERVVHRPRRMALGHVERGEVVPVVLDLGPGGDGEAHVGEDLGQFVHHLADRMDRTARGLGRGQRQVDPLARQPRLERRALERRLALGQRSGHAFAQAVYPGALVLPLLRRHPSQRLQQRRNRPLLAEELDAQRLERVERLGARYGGDGLVNIDHCLPLLVTALP